MTQRHSSGLLEMLARGAARGVVGGLVATAVMSGAMLAAQKAGLVGKMPPQKIADHLLLALGVRHKTSETGAKALGTLSHFAFGAACGGIFGTAAELQRDAARGGQKEGTALEPLERGGPSMLVGILYGMAIWTVSYAGWVPALGIMRRPGEDRTGRPTTMALAHAAYGAVLAKVVGSIGRSDAALLGRPHAR